MLKIITLPLTSEGPGSANGVITVAKGMLDACSKSLLHGILYIVLLMKRGLPFLDYLHRIMYSTVFLSLKVTIHCEQYQNKFLYERYSIQKGKMYEPHIFFCNLMPLSYTIGQGPLSTCSKSCGLVLRHYGISVDIIMVRRFMANLNNCIFHNA